MKINFSKIKIIDLDGKPIEAPKIYKAVANAIWKYTEKLDLIEIAREINQGHDVDLRESEVAEVVRIIKSKEAYFFAYAKKALLDLIDERKKAEKSQAEEKKGG